MVRCCKVQLKPVSVALYLANFVFCAFFFLLLDRERLNIFLISIAVCVTIWESRRLYFLWWLLSLKGKGIPKFSVVIRIGMNGKPYGQINSVIGLELSVSSMGSRRESSQITSVHNRLSFRWLFFLQKFSVKNCVWQRCTLSSHKLDALDVGRLCQNNSVIVQD